MEQTSGALAEMAAPLAAHPRCYAESAWHDSKGKDNVPARDVFHDAVKIALEKDGWTITDDPLFIQFGGVDLFVDLGAEKIIAAEKNGQRIAVEIKSFVGASLISEFHTALGQFMNYRLALEEQDPGRALYLAVPLDTYRAFFTLPFAQVAVQRYQLKLMVYDVEQEVIVTWQN